MIKALTTVATAFTLMLMAPVASAAGSGSCTSTSCTATIDDANPGWLQVEQGTSYVFFTVYFNNWNSARYCWIGSSDANFDRISRVANAVAAFPTKGYRGSFYMTFTSSGVCSSASATWYR